VHKTVNLHDAIVQSCNVFFYDLGARPGMMNRMASLPTSSGSVHPRAWDSTPNRPASFPPRNGTEAQDSRGGKSEGFMIGHALNTAIGEGDTRVTALQMALAYAAIANGGKLWLPQIVERVESPDGKVLRSFPRVCAGTWPSPPNRWPSSAAGCTVSSTIPREPPTRRAHTTSKWPARLEPRRSTGAGGSAKTILPCPTSASTHAWFVGYAPAAKPRISFAVFVEHGGHGGAVAAPGPWKSWTTTSKACAT